MAGADVVVVGAGVIGLAVAHELARGGSGVTVVSADVPGSRQSAGRSRIFRLAHADGDLTDAAARSLELWAAWEERAGCPLLDRTGLLLTGDMAEREVHLRRYGGLERVDGTRHPLGVAWDGWLVEATGAAIRAEATVRFLQRGLDVILDEAVGVDSGGVTLAGGRRLDAGRVVVCAGPATYALLGLPEPERRRSVRMSFGLRTGLRSPAPCWIQRDPRLGEPFYAVMDGPDHYSVGLSEAGPAEIPEAVHVRDAHRRLLAIVVRALPGLVPVAERVIACEYTTNPHRAGAAAAHDGWDLPERDGVLGVAGPSLFKFAPLLGRLVADRVSRDPACPTAPR